MTVLLSAVRLVTAPFRSAISFGNAGVQLGVGGMARSKFNITSGGAGLESGG
jgi:hypothetical protein